MGGVKTTPAWALVWKHRDADGRGISYKGVVPTLLPTNRSTCLCRYSAMRRELCCDALQEYDGEV